MIPENMFSILSDVVSIQANELKEMPVKVAREEPLADKKAVVTRLGCSCGLWCLVVPLLALQLSPADFERDFWDFDSPFCRLLPFPVPVFPREESEPEPEPEESP